MESPTFTPYKCSQPSLSFIRSRITPSSSSFPSSSFCRLDMTISTDCPNNSTERRCSLAEIAPVEAVLFDIDGTLCDSDPIHYYAFREMLQQIGYNGGVPINEEFFIEHISGKHNDEIGSFLFPEDHQTGVKFMEDKEAMFRSIASKQLVPVEGLNKLCQWIKDRGFKRAAVTNAPRENAELMLSLLGLTDFFQLLVVGSECDRAKPFPDPYLKALKIIGSSAEHTFIFEDSISGIKAGVAAGMPVIGLTTRNPENLLMEAKPAFLIKDFNDQKLWSALEDLDTLSGDTENPEA